MGQKQQVPPNLLDHRSLASDQRRRQRAGDEFDDRRTAGADRIAIADPDCAVGVGDANDRRLLTDEGLNRIDPLRLRDEIDHSDLDAFDGRHRAPPLASADWRRLDVADCMDAAHDRPAGRLVMMVVGDLSDQSKAVHDQDAVGERDHFRHVAGDEKNGGALAGDLADELMQVGLGLDVDADRRLVDDEDLGLRREPFGDRNLLLVSAGEIADDLVRARACGRRAA